MPQRWETSFRSSDFNGDSRRDRSGDARTPRPALAQLEALEGRPCAQGEWCASSVTADGPGGPVRVPFKGPRAFCGPDRGKVAVALDALPRDYAALAADLGNPEQTAGTVRSPFGPRIPLRLGSEALMRAMTESLTSWHDRVAGVDSLSELPDRDDEGRRIARDGWLLDRAVKVLSPRLDALLALDKEPVRRAATHHLVLLLGDDAPDGTVRSGYAALRPDLDGGDAGLEILRLHRMAQAVLGETRPRPVELLGVPCRVEDCDKLALRRADLPDEYEPGDENAPWSACAVCGDVMTEAEYRDWTRRYARWAKERREAAGESR
jgi:hypothetical protein